MSSIRALKLFGPQCPWLANGIIVTSWGPCDGQSNRLQPNPLWKSLTASVDSSGPCQGLPPSSICVPLPESVLYPSYIFPHPSKSGQKSEGQTAPRSSDQAVRDDGKCCKEPLHPHLPVHNSERLFAVIKLYNLLKGPQGHLSPISSSH